MYIRQVKRSAVIIGTKTLVAGVEEHALLAADHKSKERYSTY